MFQPNSLPNTVGRHGQEKGNTVSGRLFTQQQELIIKSKQLNLPHPLIVLPYENKPILQLG